MNNPIRSRFLSTIPVIAASLLSLAFAAHAGPASVNQPQDVLAKTVTYGDLNLESEQGAKVLYARLRSAARQVCRPVEGIELSSQRAWSTCVDEAVSSAVIKVNRERVTALHNQTTSRSAKS